MVLNCASLRHVIPITSSLQAERHKIPNHAGLWLVCNTSLSILSASKLILHYRPRVPPQRKQASACSFSKLKHTRYLPELDFFVFFFFSLWAERCGSERDSLNVRKPINNAHTACYSSNSLCSDGSQNLVCLCVCVHTCQHLRLCLTGAKALKALTLKPFLMGKGVTVYSQWESPAGGEQIHFPGVLWEEEIPLNWIIKEWEIEVRDTSTCVNGM